MRVCAAGTLTYLNGTTPECCPTRVIPGSFRSCRRPRPGETSWEGRGPLAAIAKPGDTLLFRSDVWHAGGTNVTENTTRLTVEAAYGARKVSQKFWPYLDMKLSERTRELATPLQLRLLGEHPLSNYG